MRKNEIDYFSVGREKFYLDLEEITKFIKLEKKNDIIEDILNESNLDNEDFDDQITESNQMIDITRWELTKGLIDVLLSEGESIIDEDMGIDHVSKSLSIPFRLAFNTLLNNKIIKKK